MSEHFLEEHIKRIRDLSEQITRVRPLYEVRDFIRYESNHPSLEEATDRPCERTRHASRRRRG
jgi:hypothetical protein